MKTILITGGAGFIGSNFVHYLLQKESFIRIINLDLLTYAGKPNNTEGFPTQDRHIFVKGDICDRELLESLFQSYEIDTIVHFAAESHVDRSILNPMPFLHSNVVGTVTLLEVARKYWVGRQGVRFHHISTDEVFGALQPTDPPFDETTPYNPHSPYSASKAASDHFVRAYHDTYGLPITLSNCSNNYGPRQFPEKLIPLMVLNGIMGKSLPVYGQGAQIRDWLYVDDHCEAIYQILKNGRIGETYCIGGENQLTNLEIVTLICEILDKKAPRADGRSHHDQIAFVADRPGHDFRYDICFDKIRAELSWRPRFSLQSGLETTIDWYLGNSDWVDSVIGNGYFSNWIEQNYQNRGGKK